MPLFWIDGFNLFYRWSRTSGLFGPGMNVVESQEQGLKAFASALGKNASKVVIYMDGGLTRGAENRNGLRVIFAGPGRKTDDQMLDSIRSRGGQPEEITVVSDDRELAGNMHVLGARVMRVQAFLDTVATKNPGKRKGALEKKFQPLSKNEVDAWVDIFETEE